MKQFMLASVFGKDRPKAQVRKLHAVLFLAQSRTQVSIYSFTLEHGRVWSEDLDHDLVALYVAGVSLPYGVRDSEEDSVRLNESVSQLLKEDDEVVEAAATAHFFRVEGLGDPSTRLRWFGHLNPGVVSRAEQIL